MAFRRREPQSEGAANSSSSEDLEEDVEEQRQKSQHHGSREHHRDSWGISEGRNGKIKLKERIKHFTWAWFTLTMSTGGFATLLSVQPHSFTGLLTIGTIVYIFDLVLFVLLVAGITARFIMYPGTFHKSLKHPSESFFFATFWLSLPTIIGGMNNYGADHVGSWLIVTLRVLFWLYCACTLLVAVFHYWYLFMAKQLTVGTMSPAWILPIFPAMLTGTLASLLAGKQPPDQAMAMIVAGVMMQGLGWTVATMIYAVMIVRLMTYGLPAPNARPGMFICVGPPAFTALALIGMSNSLPEGYGYFAEYPAAINTLRAMALFIGIFIWAIGFWWFCIAIISVLYGVKKMGFSLVWWAMVFPNVGLTIAVIDIGEQLQSQGIQWVGSIMTILVFIMWLVNIISHARAVITKQMMMPGMDEDDGEDEEETDEGVRKGIKRGMNEDQE